MALPENDGNAEYGGPLWPHPLICGLAVGVDSRGSLAEAIQAAAYSVDLGKPGGGPPFAGEPPEDGDDPRAGGGDPPAGGGDPPTGGGDPPAGGGDPPAGGGVAEPPNLRRALGSFPGPKCPPVVVFAGYLGPQQTDPFPDHNDQKWRLLYQDAKAMSWLMVPERAIVLFSRIEDHKAAFRLRDYIWVRADAPVRQGTEEESEQARFLVGTFTSAGDLHDALSGRKHGFCGQRNSLRTNA